jgi:hypothetical protein
MQKLIALLTITTFATISIYSLPYQQHSTNTDAEAFINKKLATYHSKDKTADTIMTIWNIKEYEIIQPIVLFSNNN